MSSPRLSRPRLFHLNGAACCLVFAMLGSPGSHPADLPAGKTETRSLPDAATTNPAVKAIGPGLFQLGAVRFDKNRQTVSFPALVNMREGNLEYLIVTTTGKTHESLLRTEAQAFQIHLALLLLGAKGTTNALPE